MAWANVLGAGISHNLVVLRSTDFAALDSIEIDVVVQHTKKTDNEIEKRVDEGGFANAHFAENNDVHVSPAWRHLLNLVVRVRHG